MRPAERPPCRVFCHLRLEALHGFLTMRFGVRCLRQEIGAVLNITCSMAVSSKSGNTKLVADALQRELSDAGVRFVASFDLDAADAESAQSEGAEGAEEAEGAEKAEGVESAKSAEGAENGQGANAAASVPTVSVPAASIPAASVPHCRLPHRFPPHQRLPHRRLRRRRARLTWYSSASGAIKAHAVPLFSIFFRGLRESAFSCSAPAASVKATSISRKFSTGFARIYPLRRSASAARCAKARWAWA